MMKKAIAVFLAAIFLLAMFMPVVSAAENNYPDILRLSGDTRYDTACSIADEYEHVQGENKVDTVVIASGLSYADALAGVPLADNLNAPILLTAGKDSLEKTVADEIRALGAKNAIVLGGPSVVSDKILSQLENMGLKTTRLSGQTRYETALAISQYNIDKFGAANTVFVVSGENFPDALSASSAASVINANIVFSPKTGEIKDVVKQFIKQSNVTNAVIVGGTGAVGERAETELSALGVTSKRVCGDSRYTTSLAVYSEFFDVFDSSTLTFATGANFPDALAGAVFSAKLKAPVVLVNNELDNSAITKAIQEVSVDSVVVYGGEDVVTPNTIRKIFAEKSPATSSTSTVVTTTSTTVSATKTSTSTTTKPTTTTAQSTTTTQKPTTTATLGTTTTTQPTTTTTVKPITTITTTNSTTTTTTATTAPTTVPTTAPTTSGRWVSQSEMNRILSNIKAHSESIGMYWDISLNAETAGFWGGQSREHTTGYDSASAFESRVKGIISYYYNKNVGFEYVNVIVTSAGNGEYTMTCYFG